MTDDLGRIERDVLERLCASRVTRSHVRLALEMWDDGHLRRHVDPTGLVRIALDALNERDYVVFNLGSPEHDTGDIATNIRVTPKGYRAAGYIEPMRAVVGTHAATRSHVPLHLGPTDYRSLDEHTTGGAIERMTLREHIDVYPDHRTIHPDPDDIQGERTVSSAQPVPDRAVDALRSIGRPAGLYEVADREGRHFTTANGDLRAAINEGKVRRIGNRGAKGSKYALADWSFDEEATSTDATQRDAILAILKERERVEDALVMARLLAARDERWRGLGGHSVAHQLQNMRKAGLVEFNAQTRDGHQKLTNIRLPKAFNGNHAVTVKPETDPIASDAAIEATIDVLEQLAPDVSAWPVLEKLRAREERTADLREAAAKYLEAAAIIESVNPSEAERLATTANEIAQDAALSPIEAEYLAFAKEHER